jgi:signal transduction histidine kinase
MSSRWRESLRHAFALRLALWYAAVFGASALALVAATYVLLARSLAAQDHDVLESMLERYKVEFDAGGLDALERLIDADSAEGRHERVLVRVVGPAAEVIYFATPPGWSDFDLSALDGDDGVRPSWLSIERPSDGAVLEVGSVRLRSDAIVQVGRSSRVRDDLLAHFRSQLLAVLLVISVIAVLGGGLLTYVGLAPVRALERTLRSILATRRFESRVSAIDGGDSLDQLGVLVNELLARIQALLGAMRGALDNVAHDLRTPLTRFRNTAEAAVVSGDPGALREGLEMALEEADRIGATLTALMDVSEAETGAMRLTRKRVVLADVVAEALSLYADAGEDAGLTMAVTVDPSIVLMADHVRVRQVLANLLDNAVKYTPRGGRIDVRARVEDGHAAVVVADTGTGIPADELPLIWDRLYRADASRATRGLGLGLSLVKAIVTAHGGHVHAVSAPGQGSVFTITLPLAEPATAAPVS